MKRKDSPRLETAADSHIGQVRTNNEDRFAVVPLECNGVRSVLALVADGVGGHAAGEVASQTAVETAVNAVRADPCANPVKVLPEAVIRAGQAVFSQAAKDPALRGMATTLAAVWVVGRRLYSITVGDSRIYMRRKGITFQASVDHTWVQEAVEHGLLTPDQAHMHPNAHVLRRHLGGEKDPQPDPRLRISPDEPLPESAEHQGMTMEDGDALVLCTDGLSDLVQAEDIGRALRHRRLERTIQELIELARRRGGHDNITVAALRFPAAEAFGPFPNWLRRIVVFGLSALILAAAAVAAYAILLAPGR
ncbi:MAG: serine/threonine-protein phosphatase [Anaerolineales bacterium]|nr:serine/threonine-protein phosphatase [Anaerolineales bacterium]